MSSKFSVVCMCNREDTFGVDELLFGVQFGLLDGIHEHGLFGVAGRDVSHPLQGIKLNSHGVYRQSHSQNVPFLLGLVLRKLPTASMYVNSSLVVVSCKTYTQSASNWLTFFLSSKL